MDENITEIVESIGDLLRKTRAGSGIERIYFDPQREQAVIEYHSGLVHRVSIAGDSGIAAIKDIVERVG